MPAQVDSGSDASIIYAVESTRGTHPGSGNRKMRYTSETLNRITDSVRSAEVRSDRQVADIIRTTRRSEGDINFEMSWGTQFDDLIEAAMFRDFSTSVDLSSRTIDVDTTASTFTDVGAADAFANIAVGDFVRMGGFANSANNGIFRVTAKSGDDEITVAEHVNLVTESGTGDETVESTGTTYPGFGSTADHSLYVQKSFGPSTTGSNFHAYPGMRVNEFGLSLSLAGILTGRVGLVGDPRIIGSSITGGSAADVDTDEIQNSIDHVSTMIYGAINPLSRVMSFDFTVSNGLRPLNEIGSASLIDVANGTLGVSGTMEVYFSDATAILAVASDNWVSQSMWFLLQDTLGNQIILSFPAVRFTNAEALAGGIDTETILKIDFEGYRESAVSQRAFSVTKIAA